MRTRLFLFSLRANLATRVSDARSADKLVVVWENGVQHRGPGSLVPRPARLRGAFPNLQSAQNTALRALPPGRVPVQAPAEDRGSDTSSAGLRSLPPHQEQRPGSQPPGESGERRV